MQKLLFMCYGQSLAMNDSKPLFNDDTPKAWPFGPVFPRSYKRYDEQSIPTDLSDVEKGRYAQDVPRLRMIAQTVANFCHVSATRLSDWSHAENSPWWTTVFDSGKAAWNREISSDVIRDYFSNPNWSIDI